MRIATAGIGLRSGHVLSLWKEAMPEMTVVGYFDPNPTHLERIGYDTPAYESVSAMLDDTRPDLLFVGSPNLFHYEQIEIGLRYGVRVFSEKPVVISLDETMKLAALLAKYGEDRLIVGLVLRYSRHMADLQSAISGDALGPIISIEASEHIAPYHGAFFMRDWRRMNTYSGGFMLEKCCHDLDIYNMITGSRAHRVASFGGRRAFLPEHSANDQLFHVKPSVWQTVDNPFSSNGDIVDHQVALVDYESGAAMAFHTNMNVPDEQRRFCVIGARGMAEGDFMRGYLKVTGRDGKPLAHYDYHQSESESAGAHYGADGLMIKALVSFFRNEVDQLPVTAIDALEAGMTALAIDKARQSGTVVHLDEWWHMFDQRRSPQ